MKRKKVLVRNLLLYGMIFKDAQYERGQMISNELPPANYKLFEAPRLGNHHCCSALEIKICALLGRDSNKKWLSSKLGVCCS